ncbi:MAG: pyridoxamine 5'-phosphate oxidase family protein [Candidatus Limnocylindria bacterium]
MATSRPDGRPHVAGVGAMWLDGKIYIVTGAGTRKGRNLATNPNCVVSVALEGTSTSSSKVQRSRSPMTRPSAVSPSDMPTMDGPRGSAMARSPPHTARRAPGHRRGTCM